MRACRWLRIRLRRDWVNESDALRVRFRLRDLPPPGWYMLSVMYCGEQLRCYGLLQGSQGRVLIRNRLRRRLVRIAPGSKELVFELYGLNGEAHIPLMRLTAQPRWRVLRLLRRKLLLLHPGYDHASPKVPLPRLWRDYNRLLSRGNWPLVGYDEWIERQERAALMRERQLAEDEQSGSQTTSSIRYALRHRLRFVPGFWGRPVRPGDQELSQASLARQIPGFYELIDQDQAAEVDDADTWLVLLQVGDRLAPQALRSFADAIAAHPSAQIFYGDEDRISARGRRHSPQFKPAWNLDLLYSDPHFSHSWLIRSDLLQQVAAKLDAAGEPISLYGLVLEATASLAPEQIVHVPAVLYHRADRPDECRGDGESAAILERFLTRHGQPVSVTPRAGGGHRLQWPLPDPAPLVSIIILTRDRVELLRCCLDSLDRTIAGQPATELLVIDNGSSDPSCLAYLEELQTRSGVRVLRRPGVFNFAAFNNEAAALARGDVLAFLNNDVEALQPGWLQIMMSEAIRPGVGAVGARLIYEDGSVQHGGVLLGIGGIAGHAHKYFDGEAKGYQLRLQLTHQVSAVTAAVLVIRRVLFDQIGGFDADHLAVSYNDVDLCLRLMTQGYRNLYCPDAVLVHHESRSRGTPTTPSSLAQWQHERQIMLNRWGDLLKADPHYSPHLSLVEENFSLAMRSSYVASRLSVCSSAFRAES